MNITFDRARDALDFLEHHRVEPTPPHYELALNYLANPASELAREIEAIADDGLRLTTDTMASLVARFLSRDPGNAVDQRERTVARQAAELSTLSSGAHDLTSALERDVGTIVAQADDWPNETNVFVARLSDAERDLADMRRELARLRTRIDSPGGPRPDDTERDDLTQALNQSGARLSLEQLSDYDRSYVMLMFGVDDLVGLNERFGRPVGDNVLNAFAAMLQQVFEDEDLIRWSGNEFVIVLKNSTLLAARVLAEEALATLRARRLKLRGSGDWIGVVTASGGIVTGQKEPVPLVLNRVRVAMMTAAAHGGDRSEG